MPNRLETWLLAMGQFSLPILNRSAATLRAVGDDPHSTIQSIRAEVLKDPQLTLEILKAANINRPAGSGVTTIDHAALMLGMPRLFDIAKNLPAMDKLAADDPRIGMQRIILRSYHAAVQARDWAVLRHDITPDEVFIAALFYDLGELAVWCFDPFSATMIDECQQTRGINPHGAQIETLGFTFSELQQKLALQWQLPAFASECLMPENALRDRHLGVMLAALFARDVEQGWHTEATLERIEMIAEYLGLSPDACRKRLQQNAIVAARQSVFPQLPTAASLLPQIFTPTEPAGAAATGHTVAGQRTVAPKAANSPPPVKKKAAAEQAAAPPVTKKTRQPRPDAAAGKPDIVTARKQSILKLKAHREGSSDPHILMRLTMEGLYEGTGLGRVVFCLLTRDKSALKARYLLGTDDDPAFKQFQIDMHKSSLFSLLMKKPQAVWVKADNREKYWPLVPVPIRKLTGSPHFFAQSLFVNERAVGLFYADNNGAALNEQDFKHFRQFARLLATAMSPDTAKPATAKTRRSA